MKKVLPSLAYCEHCEEQFTDPDEALMCVCYDCWKKIKADGIREGLKIAAEIAKADGEKWGSEDGFASSTMQGCAKLIEAHIRSKMEEI